MAGHFADGAQAAITLVSSHVGSPQRAVLPTDHAVFRNGPVAEVTIGLSDFSLAHFNPDGREKEISIRLG